VISSSHVNLVLSIQVLRNALSISILAEANLKSLIATRFHQSMQQSKVLVLVLGLLVREVLFGIYIMCQHRVSKWVMGCLRVVVSYEFLVAPSR
jgi:hypothetical protein